MTRDPYFQSPPKVKTDCSQVQEHSTDKNTGMQPKAEEGEWGSRKEEAHVSELSWEKEAQCT